MIRVSILLSIILVSSCGGLNSRSFTKIFESSVENGFSGVALVQRKGEVLLHEAAGFSNRERAIPNTVETAFDIASITKQFTASLIVALQEAGQLSVEDKLSDHFDNVPEQKARITIHQLMTHSSGIQREFGRETVAVDRDIFLSLVWATKLEYEPGTVYRYSNVGYSLLAAIVESVTGQSYESALHEYLFEPAELTNTGYLLPARSNESVAVGNISKQSFHEWSSWWADDGPYWFSRGAGGLLSTTGDLLKWHRALASERVLTTHSIKSLQARQIDKSLGNNEVDESESEFYGYGWSIQDSPEVGEVHWHTGSNRAGFRSFFGRVIAEDIVIIVLTNDYNEAAKKLPDELAQAITLGM